MRAKFERAGAALVVVLSLGGFVTACGGSRPAASAKFSAINCHRVSYDPDMLDATLAAETNPQHAKAVKIATKTSVALCEDIDKVAAMMVPTYQKHRYGIDGSIDSTGNFDMQSAGNNGILVGVSFEPKGNRPNLSKIDSVIVSESNPQDQDLYNSAGIDYYSSTNSLDIDDTDKQWAEPSWPNVTSPLYSRFNLTQLETYSRQAETLGALVTRDAQVGIVGSPSGL